MYVTFLPCWDHHVSSGKVFLEIRYDNSEKRFGTEQKNANERFFFPMFSFRVLD